MIQDENWKQNQSEYDILGKSKTFVGKLTIVDIADLQYNIS